MPDSITVDIPRGSVEYLEGTITSTSGTDLTMPVELAISRGHAHTWLSATWTGDPGPERVARTSSPVAFDAAGYPDDEYAVYARLAGDPESPIIHVGGIRLY